MTRVSLAIKSFFGILFGGSLPVEVATAFGYIKGGPKKPASAPPAAATPADGAIQMLGLLQRDARLVDFLMEDISAYSDDQVGAAVRTMHEQCRQILARHARLAPVIDGVEGTRTRLASAGLDAKDASTVRLIGNVPPGGGVEGGILRHKGWRVEKLDLPPLPAGRNVAILAPAEVEVE